MTPDSRSVLTRPAPAPDLILSYGDHAAHVCDLRLPARAEGAPLVIFLHGGFWRREYDRTHTGPLAAALVAEGYAVATPEFRRTGMRGGGWPGTLDDVAAATRTVPELAAARTGVDAARVVLGGHSAGGQLALWAAGAAPALSGGGAGPALSGGGAVPARGVVALAPVADLRAGYDLDLDDGAVSALLGGGPDRYPERYRLADPMSRLPLGRRAVVVHGDEDGVVPVEFSRRYAAAARHAGDEVHLVELPRTGHFALIDPESSAWPAVVAAFKNALNEAAG